MKNCNWDKRWIISSLYYLYLLHIINLDISCLSLLQNCSTYIHAVIQWMQESYKFGKMKSSFDRLIYGTLVSRVLAIMMYNYIFFNPFFKFCWLDIHHAIKQYWLLAKNPANVLMNNCFILKSWLQLQILAEDNEICIICKWN